MEENKITKKRHIKILVITVFCFIAVISIIGYTYSYFVNTISNNTTITGTVESTNITVTVTKMAPSTDNGLTPQLDIAIPQAIVGTNGKSCVNENLNEVCEVHKIEVKNTGGTIAYFDGTLELFNNDNPNLKWAIIDNYTTGMITKPKLLSRAYTPEDTFLTANEKYEANQTKIYYIVVWVSETGSPQNDTGTFTGTVTFKNAEAVATAMDTLTLLNLTSSIKTDTPNFSLSSCTSGCEESTVGLYPMEDDLGTSYYFRGDVENNYVKFGKLGNSDKYVGFYSTESNNYREYSSLTECQNSNFYNYNCTSIKDIDLYWRILRINGDGTIRLIYTGIEPNPNDSTEYYHTVTSVMYNEVTDESLDNTYVGYMTGKANASTYEETHSNLNDSSIKTYLEDTWYANTLKDTEYEEFVADAIYCNDRSLDTSDSSYTGIGKTDSSYAAKQRLDKPNPEPTLKCKNKNDRFTHNTSVNGISGNAQLEAPVGLLTADEVLLTGMKMTWSESSTWKTTTQNYFRPSSYVWTMTPGSMQFYLYAGKLYGEGGIATLIDFELYLSSVGPGTPNREVDVIPVISLKADALKYSSTSNGSFDYPFTVTG